MIGGRVLTSAIKNGTGSAMKVLSCQSPSMQPSTRALSSLKAPFVAASCQQKYSGSQFPDMKLVSKRFSHYGGGSFNDKSSFMSKLLATAGAILGIGSGAAYHMLADKNSIFHDYYQVACAEDCIEKKCEDSPCLRKMDREEELILKANADLEKALKDVKTKAIEYTEAAMKAYCEAVAIMKEFMNQGYCAIDADNLESPRFEETWCCVYDIAGKRCEKVRDALQKGQCAWELLCRLREVIENGKGCKYTSCNPLLVTAEESLTCAERELLNLKAKMDCVNSDHDMVELYRNLIEDFRKDLKGDLDAMGDVETCKIQFTEQETAMMINQAYRRVVRAHKEMAQVLVCTGRVPERLQTTLC